MSADKNKKVQLAHLAREKGIKFYLDPSPEDWPELYSKTFSEVCKIETVKFGTYRDEARHEPEKTPWKVQRVRAAEELVQLTKRCIDERQAEAGWRSKLETEIFGRFTHGLSCGSCGGRLWRALEDPSESTFEPLKRLLNIRRECRQECECARNGEPLMQKRALSELFSSRSGEYLTKDSEVTELLPKQGPDLVYGLRKTEALEKVLSRECVHTEGNSNGGKALSDAIQTSPYAKVSEPLIFPFLIAEFKSEKNAEGFYDIQSQTALPIRRLLRLQMDLRSAARTISSRVLTPLVWFFALRGDDVRIYAAYNAEEDAASKINVLCLLDCRISKRDGALRLLLIVDYLFEWARDIYYALLKHQLQLIVAPDPDSVSFHDGTNATTLRRYRKAHLHDAESLVDTGISDAGAAAQLSLEELNTKFGIVQSACYIRSKVRGLILESSNVDSFFNCLKRRTNGSQYVRKLADKLIRQFRVPAEDQVDDRCLVSEQTLCQLEEAWTENIREPWCVNVERTNLWVKIQYSTYLSHDWEQVREISYIAVSQEGLKGIDRWSKAELTDVHPPLPIEPGILERVLGKIKEGSIEHNLAAAICRSTLSIPEAIFDSESGGQSLSASSIWDQDVPLKPSGVGLMHEIVVSIFEILQDRRKDLPEFRLRESLKDELQQHQTSTWSRPINTHKILQVAEGVVVVLGEFSAKTRARKELGSHRKPDLCVFTLDQRNMSAAQLGSILNEALLGWMIYPTLRHDWPDLSATHMRVSDKNRKLELLAFNHSTGKQYHAGSRQGLATSIVKWIELLGQTVSDEVPSPIEPPHTLNQNPVHIQDTFFESKARYEQTWNERMAKCVEDHRKLRGIHIEQERISESDANPSYEWIKLQSKSNEQNSGSEQLSEAALAAAEDRAVPIYDVDTVMSDYSIFSPSGTRESWPTHINVDNVDYIDLTVTKRPKVTVPRCLGPKERATLAKVKKAPRGFQKKR